MVRYLLALAAGLVLLAGCAGAPAKAPSARQLAGKIPGCTHVAAQAPSVPATGEAVCRLPAASGVEVATFATMSGERQWIAGHGNTYGCCVEGRLWAATYYSQANQFPAIMKALGGKAVTG